MNRQEFERVARLEAQQQQAELEAQKGNPHFQARTEEVTEEEATWFRCECGKAFSDEEEIRPPNDACYRDGTTIRYHTTIRYYFKQGTVLFKQDGTRIATCYECAEGS